jgi:hypothetical protein
LATNPEYIDTTGTIAGNIIATIPTTHTRRNDEIMPTSGEKNMLAIEEIEMIEVLIAIGSEFCRMKREAHQPMTAKASSGIPTESLKRSLGSKPSVSPPRDVLSTLNFSSYHGQFPLS